jgi:hypothetical protein
MASINQTCNALPNGAGVELQKVLEGLRADLEATRAEVVKLVADMASRIANHNTLRAKLNLDGGVTDVDYAAATAITAADPAAMTVTA